MKASKRASILRDIRYLLAIDEHRSFTRAADALYVSQPALSQKIRQLEEDLGAPLFDRSGRGITLTDYGETYLGFARRAFRDLEAAQRAMQDVEDLSRGELRLAFTPTFTEYLVAPLVEAFYASYPKVFVELREMSLDDVEAALTEDSVDLGLGFLDVRSDDVEAEPLYPERLMLVVGATHPLAKSRSPVTPKQLAQTPLALLATGFVSRYYVDSYFNACGITPTVSLHANSISAILKTVRRGRIATILPSTIEFEHRDFRYVALDPPFPLRTVALLRRKRAYRSVASAAFESMLRSMLNGGSLSSLRTLTTLSPDGNDGLDTLPKVDAMPEKRHGR
ncbi:HTH-type transcriptional regulator CynR (plasmid) [Pararobbsia alpina]|uniref:transcriptional regulator CynR n=1 Tax=Pararobbsia alpina TaxID=621374 RepID=UPI0039A63733